MQKELTKTATLNQIANLMEMDLELLRADKINLQKARELTKLYNARLKVFDLKIKAAELVARHTKLPLPELIF